MNAARGLCLVKYVETQDTLPGGKVVLVDDARRNLARYQVEIVDVGPPEICEDRDSCPLPAYLHAFDDPPNEWVHVRLTNGRLSPGAWAIVRPRSMFATSVESDLYVVKQRDVVGVFRTTEEQ